MAPNPILATLYIKGLITRINKDSTYIMHKNEASLELSPAYVDG